MGGAALAREDMESKTSDSLAGEDREPCYLSSESRLKIEDQIERLGRKLEKMHLEMSTRHLRSYMAGYTNDVEWLKRECIRRLRSPLEKIVSEQQLEINESDNANLINSLLSGGQIDEIANQIVQSSQERMKSTRTNMTPPEEAIEATRIEIARVAEILKTRQCDIKKQKARLDILDIIEKHREGMLSLETTSGTIAQQDRKLGSIASRAAATLGTELRYVLLSPVERSYWSDLRMQKKNLNGQKEKPSPTQLSTRNRISKHLQQGWLPTFIPVMHSVGSNGTKELKEFYST